MILLVLLLLLSFPLFSQAEQMDLDWDDYFLLTDDGGGITITGTVQTSQQMGVVDREIIERLNAVDLANLLQEALGLNIVRYGSYGNQAGITLRGFDSKRVAFLIDGIPANSSLDGKFDINQIDLNSIERIEVIYGGSDSKFNVSGALGGVVNIITVKRQNSGWRIGGSFSNTSAMPGAYRDRSGELQNPRWEDLLDTQNYAFFTAYGGDVYSFSSNVFVNRAANHFLFNDYAQNIRRKDNNEVWDAGMGVSLIRTLGNYSKLISASNFYYGDKNFPASGFSSNVGSQKDFSVRQNILLDMPRAFRDDLAAEVSLSWQFNRLDYVSPANAASRHDQNSLNVINRWNWYPAEKLTLGSGIDYSVIFLESTEIGSRSRHDGGVYLTSEFKLANQLLLIPSVKAVLTSGGSTEISFIPKFGLLWNITDSLALKNNYFRSFKFPDFEELYWSGSGGIGNPDLLPEDGWGTDISAQLRIKGITLESVLFAQLIKNSIHWYMGNSGIWRPENVGEAVFFGLDNKVNLEIPVSIWFIEKISLSLSYQYLYSFLLSFNYTFVSNKRIPYTPEHTIDSSLDVSWSRGSVIFSGHFESLRYHDRANFSVLKPYFLLNIAFNQQITENFTVFGTIRNILNVSYESFFDYPMPGTSLNLGIRINFNIENKERKNEKM